MSGRGPFVRPARTRGCCACSEGLYGTRPVEGGNKAIKLKTIREALSSLV
jgi:hypothetical protein